MPGPRRRLRIRIRPPQSALADVESSEIAAFLFENTDPDLGAAGIDDEFYDEDNLSGAQLDALNAVCDAFPA